MDRRLRVPAGTVSEPLEKYHSCKDLEFDYFKFDLCQCRGTSKSITVPRRVKDKDRRETCYPCFLFLYGGDTGPGFGRSDGQGRYISRDTGQETYVHPVRGTRDTDSMGCDTALFEGSLAGL